MAFTLTTQSYPYPRSSPTAPYSISTPRATSLSVAQARSHRLAGQDQHWSAPQPQAAGATLSENGAEPNSTYMPPLEDNWTEDASLPVSSYNNDFTASASNNSIAASTASATGLDQPYPVAFAPASTSQEHFHSRSPPQDPQRSSDSYTSAGNHHSSPYPASVSGSATFSDSFSSPSSQTSPFTRLAEMPSLDSNYASAPLDPVQFQYLSSQHQIDFDTGYPTSFGGVGHPSDGPASTYPDLSGASRVQASYSDRHPYYPSYNDRRRSITSSRPDYNRSSRAVEPQNSTYCQLAEQRTAAASPPHSAPPVAHTASLQQTQSVQEPTSSRLHGVGSTEAVCRRVGIMLRTQKRQQTKQTKRTSIKLSSPDGRRGKRSPTRDDSGAEEGKDSYEQVRLQRDFYERCAISLVQQVNMLGGDPMQSSGQASEEEGLNLKAARILITSLQREVETLKENLIQTQKQFYSLRQSCEDSSRSLRRNVSNGYLLLEEEDDVPLSAAPVTVYNHHRR